MESHNGGGETMFRRILVAGALALAPVALTSTPASAGGGGCTEVTSGSGAEVGLKGTCVLPTLIRLPSGGGEVTFTNYDAVDHVIVGAGLAWGSDAILHQGDSFTASFGRDGVYPFQCYIHPGMAGAVLVGDANGRGAATRVGVTLSGGSNAPTPSLAAVSGAEAQLSPNRTIWWSLVALGVLMLVVTSILAKRRQRRDL
jgi:plastocyanin